MKIFNDETDSWEDRHPLGAFFLYGFGCAGVAGLGIFLFGVFG